jgi:hypothetical protein
MSTPLSIELERDTEIALRLFFTFAIHYAYFFSTDTHAQYLSLGCEGPSLASGSGITDEW